MGQQQLLLIVLGVIIVGIAVVVGINVFTASSSNANRDAVISDAITIGSMAQQYYKKPTALGGGGNTFTGFVVPEPLRGATGDATHSVTPNGTITVGVAAQAVTLSAVGNETGNDGTSAVGATINVTPSDIAVDQTTIN